MANKGEHIDKFTDYLDTELGGSHKKLLSVEDVKTLMNKRKKLQFRSHSKLGELNPLKQ